MSLPSTRVRMLKVMRCPDAMLWYAKRVDEYVPLLGLAQGQYRSREPSGHVNFIDEEHARVVHVFVSEAKLREYPYCHSTPIDRAVPRHAKRTPGTEPVAMTMGQSHRHSAIEAAANIALGFGISVSITAVLLPAFGHQVTLGQNVAMTSVFTVASFARAYGLRRLFNWLLLRQTTRTGA